MILAAAKGIVTATNQSLLLKYMYVGRIELNRSWAASLRLGLVIQE